MVKIFPEVPKSFDKNLVEPHPDALRDLLYVVATASVFFLFLIAIHQVWKVGARVLNQQVLCDWGKEAQQNSVSDDKNPGRDGNQSQKNCLQNNLNRS